MNLIGRRAFVTGALSAAGASMHGTAAQAQGRWPERPVRFVVSLAAGGSLDFAARQCSEVMSRQLGQQVVVENRTGAGGTIGMDSVLRADPDGYTILIANDNAASAPHVLKLPHDYTKLLIPVIALARQPQVLAVHPSLGVKSLEEYVVKAKQQGSLGFASSGVGSNQHVLGAWFAREAGIKLEHVPYRGAGQAVNDLIAGHIKSAFLGPAALIPHHIAGSVTIIGQSGPGRSPHLPDIPTFEEGGVKGVVLESWYAAMMPPGTPPALAARINAVFETVLADAKLRDAFAKGVIEPIGGPRAEVTRIAGADLIKYERLVRELHLTGG